MRHGSEGWVSVDQSSGELLWLAALNPHFSAGRRTPRDRMGLRLALQPLCSHSPALCSRGLGHLISPNKPVLRVSRL